MNGTYSPSVFTISNRPTDTHNAARAPRDRSVAIARDFDLMEGLQGEGFPITGTPAAEYRKRYEDYNPDGERRDGATQRRTSDLIAEAVKCALGLSKERDFIRYVCQRREKIIERGEQMIAKVTQQE